MLDMSLLGKTPMQISHFLQLLQSLVAQGNCGGYDK